MPSWSTGVSLKGAPGLSVLAGEGAPSNTLGQDGQPGFFDTQGGRFYGPKQDGAWPTSYIQLALSGAEGSLPDDLTGNSLVLAPVEGDPNAVQLQILNSAGNAVFSCDGMGDVTVNGTLQVTGQATLPNLNASNVVSSTQTVLTLQQVRGALKVDGLSTLAAVEARSVAVSGTLQAGTLQAGDVETTNVTATGVVQAKAVFADGAIVGQELAAEKLTVGTAADINKGTSKAKFFGDVEILGDTQAKSIEASELAVSGDSTLAGEVLTGPLTVPNVAVNVPATGAASLPVKMTDADGNVLFSVDGSGNATLRGTFQIAGSEASGAISTEALTAASIVNTGDTHLQGALLVDGATTLHGVTATALTADSATLNDDLTVVGTTTLEDATATSLSTGTLEATKAATFKSSINVAGASALSSVTTDDLQASSLGVSGPADIGSGLTVGGNASLQSVSATQATLQELHVTGPAAIDGALQAGDTTLPSLAVHLPSSNASQTPVSVLDAGGNTLLSLSSEGALTVAGQLIVNGGNAEGAQTLGALTVSSFLDKGNGEVQGTFKVGGVTTLQDATMAALTAASLHVTGNSVVDGTGSFGGALSSPSLSTGPIASSSLRTRGVEIVTDQFGNGGTLTVARQTNLSTTYTSDLHPSSVASSGSVSVGGDLSAQGSTSLASLSVSGGTTLGTTSVGSLTAAASTTSGNASVGGSLSVGGALTGTTLKLQTSDNTPIEILDANGDVLLTQDGQGNLDIKGTLSVSGQPTGSANNLGAISVTSFVDSGSAQIQQNLTVQGTTTLASLSVSGTTTLGTTTLGQTTAGALTASSATITNALGVGTTLTVGGTSSLKAVTATSIAATTLSSTGAANIGTTLSVSGTSTLQNVTAAQATLAGAQVTGNALVGGTLGVTGAASFAANANISGTLSVAGTAIISGAATVPSLSISLPANGAAATPLTVVSNAGSSLLSLDASGNLVVAGNISSSNGSGSTNTGALTASSLAVTNNATIGQNLTVSGTTTLGATTVTSLVNTGTDTVAALVVQLPSSGAAAKPINLLSAANTSLFSVDPSGNALVAGTLGVTGATSLTTLTTSGAASLNSATVAGLLSAATLNTSGLASLNSLSVANSASVGGSITATGAAQANRFVATSAGSSGAPLLAYTSNTGNATGIYSDGNFGSYYEQVNGFLTRQSRYISGPPADNGAGFLSHLFYTGITGSNTAYRWHVGSGSAVMTLFGDGSLLLGAGLTVSGATRTAGLSLSSGAVTFADGTSLTSATLPNQAAYTATSAGAAATPAFRFSGGTNPSGLFFDATPGNVNVSVNGFKSLYSTAVAGAAQGANGWAIASNNGAGAGVLSLFGVGSTTIPVFLADGAGALTTTGLHKTAGLTLTSGALTFADGTSMTTAASGTGGGTATASPAWRYTTGGAPTSTNPAVQNDGDTAFDASNMAIYGPRANGAFPTQPYNLIGPPGPPGLSVLSTQSVGCGRDFFSTDTVSTTAVTGKMPGSTLTASFVPPFATCFMGATYTNLNSNVTATLINQTTGATVWSGTFTGNLTSNVGQFAIGQFPMPANNTYIWQLTAATSATAAIWVQPLYLWPAASPAYNVSQIGTAGVSNVAMTSSPNLKVPGTNIAQSFRFSKAASIYSVTINNPNAYAASANLILNSGNSPTVFSVTAPPNAVTTFGPYALGANPLAANSQYYWNTYGAGTGSLFVDASIAFSVA